MSKASMRFFAFFSVCFVSCALLKIALRGGWVYEKGSYNVFGKNAPKKSNISLVKQGNEAEEPLALTNPSLAPQQVKHTIVVKKSQNLLSALSGKGISRSKLHEIVGKIEKVHNVRSIRAGQKIFLTVKRDEENSHQQFKELEFAPSFTQKISLKDEGGTLKAQVQEIPIKRELRFVSGTIKPNFRHSLCKVPTLVNHEASKAFAHILNIKPNISKGDASFRLTYETFINDEGREIKKGSLKRISFTYQDRTHTLYSYTDRSGHTALYNEKGEGIERARFMSPLNTRTFRISSGFGRRMHPLRGYFRFHRGIDISAPRGTPVAISGNGIVVCSGWKSGYGKYVKIRHSGGYETVYAHLHRIFQDIKVGRSVRQGQCVGLVGSTGSATGSHLHHEVILNGTPINPLKVQLPIKRLGGRDLKEFIRYIKKQEETPSSFSRI